jgi:PAS domain S-box-containing protein
MGHLATLDHKPMPSAPPFMAVFQIFAARAAAELRRLRAEQALAEREEKLARIFAGALDAVLELDASLRITQANPSAGEVFGRTSEALQGRAFPELLLEASREEFKRRIAELGARRTGSRALWFPGGLSVVRADGTRFTAEATLSQSGAEGPVHYTVILRDVNDRLEAEQRIASLSAEAEYLREEIDARVRADEIVGSSAGLRKVLEEAAQVAAADSTVLIQGESGTGKELVARAIHRASRRHSRPLVTVNCAAIPATLMESEFFGHERGAFSGATQRRIGRFALADGGTLFLDEVGELPLDLQAKLLRVLQEGEFQPVGSSGTRTVDVRILAATNRDLAAEASAGRFREDLYYRLAVFPLKIPPLRERVEDIPLLAEKAAARIGRRLGRAFAPFTPECLSRLKAYPWPGNVRELENVIERAAVIARGNHLNLEGALPDLPALADVPPAPEEGEAILTVDDLAALERRNLLKALAATGWKVAGPEGAAARLGMPASTLASRMKALGIRKPLS